jgi:hypothetical protein
MSLHTFLTSALDGGEWSALRPGRFTTGGGNRHQYLLHKRLGGTHSRSWRYGEQKYLSLPIANTSNRLRPLFCPVRSPVALPTVIARSQCLTTNKQTNSVALVRKRTIPTERPPPVGEVSANFADRGCRVVSAMDPHGRILGFLDRNRYYFFQVAP